MILLIPSTLIPLSMKPSMRPPYLPSMNRSMADGVIELPRREGMLEACFLGLNRPYLAILSLMHSLHEKVVKQLIHGQLLLLEHSPVITITQQHMLRSIKTSEQLIKASGIDLFLADRGGDASFHGPGQLVGYPIVAVSDISHYIR